MLLHSLNIVLQWYLKGRGNGRERQEEEVKEEGGRSKRRVRGDFL